MADSPPNSKFKYSAGSIVLVYVLLIIYMMHAPAEASGASRCFPRASLVHVRNISFKKKTCRKKTCRKKTERITHATVLLELRGVIKNLHGSGWNGERVHWLHVTKRLLGTSSILPRHWVLRHFELRGHVHCQSIVPPIMLFLRYYTHIA